jgi:hypothetical protein
MVNSNCYYACDDIGFALLAFGDINSDCIPIEQLNVYSFTC